MTLCMRKSLEKTKIIKGGKEPRQRLLIATPTLGIVRMEWSVARYGQIIPPNWSCAYAPISAVMPTGYLVANAQNIAVQTAVSQNFEWLFLHEDDVVLPPDAFLKINNYIRKADVPVVSGLYFLKANPTEPVLYRGRGNSYFGDFKIGQKVWADGVPTGCLLIHCSLLKLMYAESEEYTVPQGNTTLTLRKVFETPAKTWYDPESAQYMSQIGTSDLYWCDRVMKDNILKRAGWSKIARKKYPFLCDTSILCKHIDLSTGKLYPE